MYILVPETDYEAVRELLGDIGGGKSALVGAGLGMIGGIVGSFAGFHARARLVKSLRQPDFNIALLEDLVAIGGSLFIVSRF